MIYTQDAASSEGGTAVVKDVESRGVRTVVRPIAPDATDVTEPVLAAGQTDAIFTWGLATTDALTVKQAAQYNFTGPVVTFSASQSIRSGVIPSSIRTDNLYEIPNCGVTVNDAANARALMASYKSNYGEDLYVGLHPRDYDAVYLVKKAIEKAGSTDGKAIGKAIHEVSMDGVCGKIQSDAHNNLQHEVSIVSLKGGKESLARRVHVESAF
jgi:ABC-type branched-subunit amino acid transport system substrate-binding protein